MSIQEHAGRAVDMPVLAPRLGRALFVIATAQCLLVLDTTIMNVALPSIQHALNLATSDLNWVITAYALAFGGLLLIGGRAGDVFGRLKAFRTGLVIFAIASLIGGFAVSPTMLIAARACQGIGAAIIAPAALSLIVTTFPAGQLRNKAFGLYGAMGAVGAVAGMLLGGALTEYVGWRWVLLVNIPLAVSVLFGTGVLVEGERKRVRVDLPGGITATLGLGTLVYAINRASAHGWTEGATLGSLASGGVLLVSFVWIQRVSRAPMLPGAVLADRGRLGANLVMFLTGAGMFPLFYFLSLYMQVVKGYSPMQAGLAYLPFALGIGTAAGAIGPQLLRRFSERTVIACGLLLSAAGMVWLSTLSPESGALTVLVPAQLLASVGLGLVFVTITVVGVRGVMPENTGVASGLMNTSQQVGGALGLALLASVAATVSRSAGEGLTVPHALSSGYGVGFLLGGALCLASLVIAVLTIKPVHASAGTGPGGTPDPANPPSTAS